MVIGPDQMPGVLYKLGKLLQRFKYMRHALARQFDDFIDHADIQKRTSEKEQPHSDQEPDEQAEDLNYETSQPPVVHTAPENETQDLFEKPDNGKEPDQ